MKKRILLSVVVVFFCAFPFSLKGSVKVEGIEILEYGIYKAKAKEKVTADSTAEGTWTVIEEIELVAQTDSIPAKVGTQFGFWFVVNGEPKGEKISLTFVNRLPGLKNPNTDEVVFQEKYKNIVSIGERSFKGYVFDFEWEAVPGKWTFQIFYEDKKLAEKTFIVHK